MTREWMLFIGSLAMLLVGGWAFVWAADNDLDNIAEWMIVFAVFGFACTVFSFTELAQTLPSGKVEVSK
jgi:hypothetical protein